MIQSIIRSFQRMGWATAAGAIIVGILLGVVLILAETTL